jgi:hypothetical protein
MMALARSPDLLLFVAGEPESQASVRKSGAGTVPRLAGMFLFGGFLPPSARDPKIEEQYRTDVYEQPPLFDHRQWHLPPEQLFGLELVLKVAGERKKSVGVIDVDQPGDQQTLVDRWVGPNDVLPVLVRSDGTKLVGVEHFTHGELLRFVGRG